MPLEIEEFKYYSVLISFADEIGISAALKKDVRFLSPSHEKKIIRQNEIIYFNFTNRGKSQCSILGYFTINY